MAKRFMQTPIFEGYMAQLISKNGHQTTKCYDEIEVRA